jgi:gliding motility-associated-like protein
MKRQPQPWFRVLFVHALFLALFAARLDQAAAAPFARAMSLGSLTFQGVYPRIFTPNGDGANDKAAFHFDNPELLPVEGSIFDISGGRVTSLSAATNGTELLLWDGKNADGQTVPGGIYLYQIEFQGKYLTGTVVVAR